MIKKLARTLYFGAKAKIERLEPRLVSQTPDPVETPHTHPTALDPR
jgi:hypothetical protein